MVNNDDKKMNISKKIIAIIMKIHVSFVLFVLGHTVFTSVSLWAGIIFVIPGFSLLLLFCFKWIDDCFATDGSKITFERPGKNLFYNGPISSEVLSNPKSYYNRKSGQERNYRRR